MSNSKAKVKIKVQANKGKKPVKATLGKGSGGLLSARIVAEVKNKRKNG